ncbi:MAG: hypothetical protein ABFD89_17700 [Bryobacteraceae bacterium]
MSLTVNDYTYDYGNVRNKTEGDDLEGVSDIQYSYSSDPTKWKGQGRKHTGRTDGSLTADDATLTMSAAYWHAWRNKLGAGFMRKEFTYTVSYADADEEVETDTLEKCKITKVEKNPKQGPDPVTFKITLSVMNVLDGGLDPMDEAD